MIFIHGWTCDSSSWTSQVPAFAKKYRVVTVDLPGHGKSASPKDGKLSMGLFARAVEAVRAETKADRVVLVGHSMGAPVIREYARLYPQHVAGLVAVDGPLDLRGFPPPTSSSRRRWSGPRAQGAREDDSRHVHAADAAATSGAHSEDDARNVGSHGERRHGRRLRFVAVEDRRDQGAGALGVRRHRDRCPTPRS